MGTSQSSSGAPSGVPMVPPWVPDLDNPTVPEGTPPDPASQPVPTTPIVPIASPRRFSATRTNIGKFASSGNSHHMKQALEHYVRGGYGGSNGATRRMSGSAAAGGRLYGALGALAGQATQDFAGSLDRQILQGRDANEILGAVVNAVSPSDGTEDAEATRDSMARAISALCNKKPDVDLLNLTEVQKVSVVQDFLANDIAARFLLDCEKAIKEKAPLDLALSRIKEIKDYIRETVASVFRDLERRGDRLGSRRANETIRNVLSETFSVFEEYLQ